MDCEAWQSKDGEQKNKLNQKQRPTLKITNYDPYQIHVQVAIFRSLDFTASANVRSKTHTHTHKQNNNRNDGLMLWLDSSFMPGINLCINIRRAKSFA